MAGSEDASKLTHEYWTHCKHLDFFQRLGLQENEFKTCVPLYFHTDGVKIYKNQKAWIYSYASATRKGTSLKTKLVLTLFRENECVKQKTHAQVAKLIGYIMDVLSMGKYPSLDATGAAFPRGSVESSRAGTFFCGGWTMRFAGFKGDWEARALVHQSTRYYRCTWICEHCLASYTDDFTFADFRPDAACLSVRFSHQQYLMMRAHPSPWICVKGWTKDRNLEVSKLELEKYFCLGFFRVS